MFVTACLGALADWLTAADFTSDEGIVLAVLAIPATLIARWKSYGAETVEEIRAGRQH